MCYLVPRSGVAVTEIWAAVALGWRWSFTVCQPGLGIVTRVSMGGLKGGREGRKEGGKEGGREGRRRRRAKQQKIEADERGRESWREGKERLDSEEVQRSVFFCVRADDFIFYFF